MPFGSSLNEGRKHSWTALNSEDAGVRRDLGAALATLQGRARDMGFAEHSLPPGDR
jgi:hypothetical protein